jgi:hypothetical protein
MNDESNEGISSFKQTLFVLTLCVVVVVLLLFSSLQK